MKNGIGTFSIFIPTYLLSKMLYVEEIVTLQLRLDLATTRALYVAGAKRGGGPVQETDSAHGGPSEHQSCCSSTQGTMWRVSYGRLSQLFAHPQ